MKSCDVKVDLEPALPSVSGVVEKNIFAPGIATPLPMSDERVAGLIGDEDGDDDDSDVVVELLGDDDGSVILGILGILGILIGNWADSVNVAIMAIANDAMVCLIKFFRLMFSRPPLHCTNADEFFESILLRQFGENISPLFRRSRNAYGTAECAQHTGL